MCARFHSCARVYIHVRVSVNMRTFLCPRLRQCARVYVNKRVIPSMSTHFRQYAHLSVNVRVVRSLFVCLPQCARVASICAPFCQCARVCVNVRVFTSICACLRQCVFPLARASQCFRQHVHLDRSVQKIQCFLCLSVSRRSCTYPSPLTHDSDFLSGFAKAGKDATEGVEASFVRSGDHLRHVHHQRSGRVAVLDAHCRLVILRTWTNDQRRRDFQNHWFSVMAIASTLTLWICPFTVE